MVDEKRRGWFLVLDLYERRLNAPSNGVVPPIHRDVLKPFVDRRRRVSLQRRESIGCVGPAVPRPAADGTARQRAASTATSLPEGVGSVAELHGRPHSRLLGDRCLLVCLFVCSVLRRLVGYDSASVEIVIVPWLVRDGRNLNKVPVGPVDVTPLGALLSDSRALPIQNESVGVSVVESRVRPLDVRVCVCVCVCVHE